MRRRIITAVVTAAAAAGLVMGGAAAALASPIATISYSVVAVTSHTTSIINGSNCTAVLLSEQVTAGGPAYVSGYVENVHAGNTCTGWLERSANGGKSWSLASSLVLVPSVSGFTDWAKLGEKYDGPGFKARVCFQIGSGSRAYCTRGVGLRGSSAKPDGFSVPLSYFRAHLAVGTPTQECTAYLSSTSVVKKASTSADGFFTAFGATCTGWEEVSANHGKTWTTVSRYFIFSSKAPATVWAFTAIHPDGTGRIARACVALGAGKPYCTAAW
jgi:hypothetical protein